MSDAATNSEVIRLRTSNSGSSLITPYPLTQATARLLLIDDRLVHFHARVTNEKLSYLVNLLSSGYGKPQTISVSLESILGRDGQEQVGLGGRLIF